jgi:hypothetical protein
MLASLWARYLRSKHAVAQRRPDAGNLVRRYLLTAAAATEDDAKVVGAADHSGADIGTQWRIIRDLTGVVDSAIVDVMAALAQPRRQARLHRNSVVVGCDCDAHMSGPRVATSREWPYGNTKQGGAKTLSNQAAEVKVEW